jgi:hypothetical protein
MIAPPILRLEGQGRCRKKQQANKNGNIPLARHRLRDSYIWGSRGEMNIESPTGLQNLYEIQTRSK